MPVAPALMAAPRRPKVSFDGDDDEWEHELWDAAEIFDETTISAAFQQQVRQAFAKLDRDLHLGFQRMDHRLMELQTLPRPAALWTPPAPGNSDLHSMLVIPSQSGPGRSAASAPSASPASHKSWASPFQDSVEFLRTASERQARAPPPKISIFTSRRVNYPVKEALWDFLVDPLSSSAAWFFSVLYPPLVLMLVLCILLQSALPDILPSLLVAEVALQMPFLAEAVARCTCTWSWYRYLSSFCNIIDVLALFSTLFAVIALVQVNDVMMKVKWSLFPTLQMMKLLRFCPQLHVVVQAYVDCWDAIFMFFLGCCLWLLPLASVLYLTESSALPQAVYDMLLVMATVGFQSQSSATVGRQILTAVALLSSMMCLVVPIAIIGSNRWQDRDIETFAQQLRRSMKDWGFPEEFFEKVLVDFDSTGAGRLSLEDFHRMAKELRVSFRPRRLVPVFHALDVSRNGTVEVSELLKLLLPSRRRWMWAQMPAAHQLGPPGLTLPP